MNQKVLQHEPKSFAQTLCKENLFIFIVQEENKISTLKTFKMRQIDFTLKTMSDK